MKMMRRRKPSLKTMVGVTSAKRKVAKATGIPTTKQGRKRKALNMATNGAYGKYIRTRAAINRPYKMAKRPPTPMGCMVWVLGVTSLVVAAVCTLVILL